MSRFVTLVSLSLLPLQLTIASPLLWQNNNALLLYGDDYRVNAPEQATLTLEHASGWGFGDLFFFSDLTRFNNSSQPDTYYAELSPRFSLGKLSNTTIQAGPVSDLLLATTVEFGKGDVEGFLVGPGLDLQIPGFDFFQLNLYKRFTANDRDGETFQLTPAWGMTIPAMGSDLVFEGYIDWNFTSNGGYRSNLHINPRLKYDLGKALDTASGTTYIGLEYSYWSNKYGIQDSPAFKTDENTLSGFLNLKF